MNNSDKQEKKVFELLGKISPREQIGFAADANKLTYSMIGFIPASDFVDTALLISNLGYLLSQEGLNVCIVDFKVFYPNLYLYLDAIKNECGGGLLNALADKKGEIKDEILKTKYNNLYLLSPSPMDKIEEYFEYDFPQIELLLENLKNMFDMVLIDIPNIPALEFCISAFKCCHSGYFISSDRLEAPNNIAKFLDFISSIGISTGKFSNIIFMNLQDLDYDFKFAPEMGFKIVSKLILPDKFSKSAYENKIYVKDNLFVNKYFIKELEKLKKYIIKQI